MIRSIQSRDSKIKKLQRHNRNLLTEVAKVGTMKILWHSKIESTRITGMHDVVCMKEKIKKVKKNNKIVMKKYFYEAKLEQQRIKHTLERS